MSASPPLATARNPPLATASTVSTLLHSSTAAAAAARHSRRQHRRIRRAGLWALVLPALLQHSITLHTKRDQLIHGTLVHVTAELNLTLSHARCHYPSLTHTQSTHDAPQLTADVVEMGGSGQRSVRVGDVWPCAVESEVWDEVVVSVRHVRSVVPPMEFQLQSAVDRQERKRQQGQRLYARRKLNVNKAG